MVLWSTLPVEDPAGSHEVDLSEGDGADPSDSGTNTVKGDALDVPTTPVNNPSECGTEPFEPSVFTPCCPVSDEYFVTCVTTPCCPLHP